MRLAAIFSFLALILAVVTTDPSRQLDQRNFDETNNLARREAIVDAYVNALVYQKRGLFTRAIAKKVKHKVRPLDCCGIKVAREGNIKVSIASLQL